MYWRRESNWMGCYMQTVKTVDNCIVVFNKDKTKVLFCKHKKDPFKGTLNFVGGKVESGESPEDAAYRELQEETGISRRKIRLYRLMDMRYYHQDLLLQIFVGQLYEDITMVEEANPLLWLSLDDEDFTDRDRFACAQNITHIIDIARMYPLPDCTMTQDGLYIGADGCKGGWIAAVLDHADFRVERYDSIETLVNRYPKFDAFLIDMAIGLCERADQHRPDKAAKEELKSKASSVFPVPCRQAVYETTEEKQKETNKCVLGKSLAKQSLAIIPKIREMDEFLRSHPGYKNVILESHPEMAFSRLSGQVLLSRKKEFLGFSERCYILSEYLGDGNDLLKKLSSKAKELGCSPDDVVDATCMAVTAAMKAHDMCETVPAEPEKDSTGLLMQMIVPKMMR